MTTETLTPPNQAPEPPAEEAPTNEPFPPYDVFEYQGIGFNRVHADKKDPEAVFKELQEFAVEKGRPEMVGLEWLEADGLRYRVSDYEKLTRVRKETKKSRLPSIAIHSVQGMELEREETYEPVIEHVDHRTVDVYNADGDLVDVLTFTGERREWKERKIYGPFKAGTTFYGRPVKPNKYKWEDLFQDHFRVSAHENPNAKGAEVKKSRDVIGFRWTEQQPDNERASRGRVATSEISSNWEPGDYDKPEKPEDLLKPRNPEQKTQKRFETLAYQQEGLGLDDWRGLTWNSPFPCIIDKETGEWDRHHVDQMRIIRDVVVKREGAGSSEDYMERVFDVRTVSPDGTAIHRHIYTLADLMEQFSNREKLERKKPDSVPALNLRWETPDPSQEGEAERPIKGTDASLDQIYEMLVFPELYPDTPEGKADLQEHIDRLKRPASHGHEQATRLQTALAEQGLSFAGFIEMVDELHDRYMDMLNRLSIEIPDAHKHKQIEDSRSWIIHSVERQLASGTGSPFKSTAEGDKLLAKLIDQRLGRRFKEVALIEKPTGKRSGKDGDSDKEKEAVNIINPAAMQGIHAFLFEKAIHHKLGLKEVDGQLDFDPEKKKKKIRVAERIAGEIEIGRLIRLSLSEV